MKPGIYELSSEAYHADALTDEPTLSATIARILVSKTPAHAWERHPKLNLNYRREESERFDIGTCAHALFLEGRQVVEVVGFGDWRSKAAKEARELARAHGRIPLLATQWDEVTAMVAAVKTRLGKFDVTPPLFDDGQPEQTLLWEEDGVFCRARPDWIRNDFTAVDDLKTVGRSADPEYQSRALFASGLDVQASFYLRGVRAVKGVDAEFRFVFVETTPPYVVSVVSLTPHAKALADEKVDYAIETWKRCLATDTWEGYPRRVAFADPPAWEETRWLERVTEVAA